MRQCVLVRWYWGVSGATWIGKGRGQVVGVVIEWVWSYSARLLFQEAYSVMRKHRLNLNFICDHNMDRFLGNARLFIQQINDVNLINIFLNELKLAISVYNY